MTIRVQCPNCGKRGFAANTAAGKRYRCPACDQVASVPLAYEQEPTVAKPYPSTSPRDFGLDLTSAIGYGLRCTPSVIWLLSIGVLITIPFAAVSGLALILTNSAPMAVLGMSCLVLVYVVLTGGYVIRYCLAVIKSTLDGATDPPKMPSWNLRRQLDAFFHWIGVYFVYGFPIITIPLFPLGLISLGNGVDGRTYNLWWAMNVAYRRMGKLAAIWFLTLLLGGVMIVLSGVMEVVMISFVPRWEEVGGSAGARQAFNIGVAVMLLMALIVSLVNGVFTCITLRWFGLLGYHSPELFRGWPSLLQRVQTAVSVVASLALSVTMMVVGGSYVVRQLHEQKAALQQARPAPASSWGWRERGTRNRLESQRELREQNERSSRVVRELERKAREAALRARNDAHRPEAFGD